jgi:hypothetical protein
VSFEVTRWPLPDDIDRYQGDLKMPRDAIVRDIARLVTVAQMVHDDELNDDLVLTGGMAMRLRGSPRFTMSDTDTSRRIPEAPDRDRLAEALTVDQAELTVSPGDVLGWKPGKKLVIARPVDYEAYFAGIGGTAVAGEFSFTVSWRGLIEPAQRLVLIHPYPELELPRTLVPVMDLTEQIAEKVVAWSAHGLMKHYVDVAWAFYRLADQIDTTKLGRLVDSKLKVGRELFPIPYAGFPHRAALRPALEHPDDHIPPQGDAVDDKAGQLRFDAAALNKQQAILVVRRRLIPVLLAED